jgi:erythromycin esterase
MMRRLLATAARFSLATLLLASSGVAYCEEEAFSKWAAAHALPLATVEPGDDFSDLLPLKSVVGTARVVALGEPMHGAHEPVAFRNRLFRFLVEQMGFTAIALETGFTESSSVDSFVGGGPGEAQSVLPKGLARYSENRELIQWMRDYNAAAGHQRIRYYGFDLSFGGRVGGPRSALDYALAYLSGADAADADNIRSSLGDALPSPDDGKMGMLSQPALAVLDGTIPKIAKAMAKNRRALIAHSSVEEYGWALHNLEVARQLAKCFHLTTPQSFRDIQYSAPVMNCRDHAMAENVGWIVKNEGPKGRVLLFGHDGHIMNVKEESNRMAKVRDKPFAMGFHLRRAFGKRLLIIAISSASTSGGLPTPHPAVDGIDDALARVGMPRMFLDLRMARQDPAALAWLSRKHPMMGETNSLITPSTAADAFVYVDRLTPAIQSADKATSHSERP